MKKKKDSVMIEEIVNEDISKNSKVLKTPEEAVEAVNNMEKILKSYKCKILCLPTNKTTYLKN